MSTCVRGPEDALAILRASGIDEELAVICLGRRSEVKMIMSVGGPRVPGWAAALEKVLVAALPGHASSVVFASCRPGPSLRVPPSDRRAWARLSRALEGAGIAAFDWIVVAGSRWRSLAREDVD